MLRTFGVGLGFISKRANAKSYVFGITRNIRAWAPNSGQEPDYLSSWNEANKLDILNNFLANIVLQIYTLK